MAIGHHSAQRPLARCSLGGAQQIAPTAGAAMAMTVIIGTTSKANVTVAASLTSPLGVNANLYERTGGYADNIWFGNVLNDGD